MSHRPLDASSREGLALIEVARRVRIPRPVFHDRLHAGRRLAEFMDALPESDAVVLGIPRGGVLVAAPIADALSASLGVVLVRKLPVPASPETGFGAVTIDGSVVLNDKLITYFGVTTGQIDRIVAETRRELLHRSELYSGPDGVPDLSHRSVCLVDDGLATGYTVLAAAQMLRKQNPRSLTLAVPCSTENTLEIVRPHFNRIYCLVAQQSSPFAVASFYERFPDLPDREVQHVLRARRN